jgi:hypothetical protein
VPGSPYSHTQLLRREDGQPANQRASWVCYSFLSPRKVQQLMMRWSRNAACLLIDVLEPQALIPAWLPKTS